MGAGLHGINGLIPTTSLHIFSTFVLPRITYSLESLNLTPADIRILETAHKTFLRQIQSLPTRVAIPSLYILLGPTLVEAHIDRNRLTLLHSMCLNNTLRDLILRQLAVKNTTSGRWVIQTQLLCRRYSLPSLLDLILQPVSKDHWKDQVKKRIQELWKNHIEDLADGKSSLKFLNKSFTMGVAHQVWKTCTTDPRNIRCAITKARLLTGSYTLQYNRQAFNQTSSALCLMCRSEDEDIPHFLVRCTTLQPIRKILLPPVLQAIPFVYPNHPTRNWPDEMLCHLILDSSHDKIADLLGSTLPKDVISAIEASSRKLCHHLHVLRAKHLGYRP